MAVEHIFDTTYFARRGDKASAAYASNDYRVIIGSNSGTVSVTNTSELEIYDPGLKLTWDGDQDRFTNAIMGATLSFTSRMDNAQLTTWEQMLDLPEGDVFCLFFNDEDGAPYWYGHLVIEDCSIRVEAEYHRVDITFTDGLAALRGEPWRDDNTDLPYSGFKKLSFYLREIINKLPGFAAYKDYVLNYLSESSIPMIREIGLPLAVICEDGEPDYVYDETDYIFDKCRVRADSFNVPKKQVDRIRELEAAQDFMNTADVLEDICKTFGATACIFDGFLNIACRHDIATTGGYLVFAGKYSYNPNTDSWTLATGGYSSVTRHFVDNFVEFRAGAVRKRTLPIAQVNLTHEEGGSDYLAAFGYFLNPNISYVDLDGAIFYQQLLQSSGSSGPMSVTQGSNTIDGNRHDLFLNFRNSADYESGTPVVDLPFYKYPADRTGYLGFEPSTMDDLELSSGEAIRLNFGGNAKFTHQTTVDATPDELVGSVLIARFRVQFTTTDDVGYRLSRTVHTHVDSNGSQDFIRINLGAGDNVDKYFFRKLYNDLEWLKDDHADYEDDGWFEVIVPHGDSDNSGDTWGATIHTLTQEYDGQLSYAPIGTKIQGDNDGAGVILTGAGAGSGTWHHWFRDIIDFELPYGDNDATLSFEEFYIEMGFSMFRANNGPRPNTSAQGGQGNFTEWSNENPTWRSENADGSGGVGTAPSTNLTYSRSPDYIHMTGLRVTQGDGSESSDLVTKITGGDGYEILNIGSSRLGSRVGYGNPHINNILELQKKDGSGSGDFVSPETFWQYCKWMGHRGDEISAISNEKYDSLHAYVAESFLQIFGQTVAYYSLSIKPKNITGGTNDYEMLKNPFMCLVTNQLRDEKDESEVLMPLSYSWTMNEGVQGDFLVVGSTRSLSTTSIDYAGGRPNRGVGGIVGLPTGVDVIRPVFQSRNVTNNISIDADTGQVTGITVNTGSTVFDADKVSQGTVNKFTDAGGLQKLGHISGDGDGLTSITVKTGSTVFNADKVSDGVINKFTTRAGQQKLNQISINSSGSQITGINLENDSISALKISPTQGRAWATANQVSQIDVNKDDVDDLQDDVTNISSKVDLISISQQHNLDDTKNRAGNIIIDAQNPTSGLTGFNVKSGATPLNADQVDQTNTTNKFATQVQINKVNHLTVSESVNLNTVNTKTGFITANAQGAGDPGIVELECAGTASIVTLLNVGETSSFKKLTAGERSNKLDHISGDPHGGGIMSFTVKSGSTPLNADQVDDSSTTKKFTDSTGNTKLSYINIGTTGITGFTNDDGATVSLDIFDELMAEQRGGQTGEKIVTVGSDGHFSEVADGTASQVLRTDGSGTLSFASQTFPVACVSGRVTTAFQGVYYYGSSSFGWNYPIWQSINFNNNTGNPYARNVIDDYAHCGIVCPMGLKNLRVYGTVRNDSGTENIILFLGKVAPPNGSSSTMVLTELGTSTVTVSTRDRHYDVDFSTTGAVAAGELIFIGIGRASTTSGTRYINFSLSIQGTL